MINIGPFHPSVNPAKVIKKKDKGVAVAGTEVNKDSQKVVKEDNKKKRRGKDRRQRSVKPLIDLRSGRDRRDNPETPSIDIEI